MSMRGDSTGYGQAAGRRAGGLLLILALLLPFGLLVLPTTLLLLAGMIPTLVALVVDRDPDKSATLTVGALNFCGIMPFCIRLWQDGHTAELSFRMLANPTTWLLAYSAAAAGWLIYFMVPRVVAGFSISRDQARIRDLEAARTDLVRDWGPDVTGQPKEAGGEAPASAPSLIAPVRGEP